MSCQPSYADQVSVLCELGELLHLDISDDRETDTPHAAYPADKFKVSALLQRTHSLPKLASLDISGKEEIQISELSPFLGTHTHLSFLGLVLTDACKDEMFTDQDHVHFCHHLGDHIDIKR